MACAREPVCGNLHRSDITKGTKITKGPRNPLVFSQSFILSSRTFDNE